MTCLDGHRGVETLISLQSVVRSMNHAYKGEVKVEFQILLKYLEYHSCIKDSLGINGYHLISRTVGAIHTLKVSLVITCQVPAVYA